ncbi:MAG: hypothetical protein ACTHJ3_01050 [Pararhizobium sp.]
MLDDGDIRVINKAKLPDGAYDYVKRHAKEMVAFLEREGDIEERAAIMEHDGGLSRTAADKFARILFSTPPEDVDPADWTWFVGKAVKVLEASGVIMEAA